MIFEALITFAAVLHYLYVATINTLRQLHAAKSFPTTVSAFLQSEDHKKSLETINTLIYGSDLNSHAPQSGVGGQFTRSTNVEQTHAEPRNSGSA